MGVVTGIARRIARMRKKRRSFMMLKDALIKASTDSGVLKVMIGTVRKIAIRSPRSGLMLRDAWTKATMESGALKVTIGIIRRIARSLRKRQSKMLTNAMTRVSTVFGAKRQS